MLQEKKNLKFEKKNLKFFFFQLIVISTILLIVSFFSFFSYALFKKNAVDLEIMNMPYPFIGCLQLNDLLAPFQH